MNDLFANNANQLYHNSLSLDGLKATIDNVKAVYDAAVAIPNGGGNKKGLLQQAFSKLYLATKNEASILGKYKKTDAIADSESLLGTVEKTGIVNYLLVQTQNKWYDANGNAMAEVAVALKNVVGKAVPANTIFTNIGGTQTVTADVQGNDTNCTNDADINVQAPGTGGTVFNKIGLLIKTSLLRIPLVWSTTDPTNTTPCNGSFGR